MYWRNSSASSKLLQDSTLTCEILAYFCHPFQVVGRSLINSCYKNLILNFLDSYLYSKRTRKGKTSINQYSSILTQQAEFQFSFRAVHFESCTGDSAVGDLKLVTICGGWWLNIDIGDIFWPTYLVSDIDVTNKREKWGILNITSIAKVGHCILMKACLLFHFFI